MFVRSSDAEEACPLSVLSLSPSVLNRPAPPPLTGGAGTGEEEEVEGGSSVVEPAGQSLDDHSMLLCAVCGACESDPIHYHAIGCGCCQFPM